MAAKILVIQFRTNPDAIESEQESLRCMLGGCGFDFKNALVGDIEWDRPKDVLKEFDASILAGSGELYFDGGHAHDHEGRVVTSKIADSARPFARYIIEHDFPTLGICFGHQLLGHAAGVNVGHSHVESKTGTIEVTLTEEGCKDPLFRGVPETFAAQFVHKDVLFDVPPQGVVLATGGERCRFSAVRYAPHVYSVQFHPERTRKDCISSMSRYQEYLPEGADPEELFSESRQSERILRNFVALAARG